MVNYIFNFFILINLIIILKFYQNYKNVDDSIKHDKILKKMKKLKSILNLDAQLEYIKLSEQINKNKGLNQFALLLSLIMLYGILILFFKIHIGTALIVLQILTIIYFIFNIDKFNFKNYTCLSFGNILYFMLLYTLFNISYNKIILLIISIAYYIILNKIMKKIFR